MNRKRNKDDPATNKFRVKKNLSNQSFYEELNVTGHWSHFTAGFIMSGTVQNQAEHIALLLTTMSLTIGR